MITSGHADEYALEVWRAEVLYAAPDPWLLNSVWERRHNISPYDSPYVALAQHYDIPLVTLDVRLSRAARAQGARVILPSAD